jgi:AGCS family alanine or glycine:cation symporter
MEAFANLVGKIDGIVWGVPMIILLFGTHLFMTGRTGFIQKKIGTAIKLSFTKDPDAPGDVSQFQALTTALASTIGTGNIIGVGTAIALGGPGAVLWCWLTGVFGIATKYAESLIAVKYRVQSADGRMQGGAMYALERGLNMKWLGIIFALFAGLCSFGIGCGTQINAISSVLTTNLPKVGLHIPPLAIGIVFGILTAIVIIGGIKSIATVCEKLVPFMAVFYVLGCLIILIINHATVGLAIAAICKCAFTPAAVGGGLVGQGVMMAARYGIARGLFSNESGLGSAPLVASAAQTRNPVRQALVSATGTFWDTVVVCLMTGLVLVSTFIADNGITFDPETMDGGALTSMAFDQIPVLGPIILVVGIVCFAFSTILGWSYYGERAIEYLLGKKALIPYKVLFVAVCVVGPVLSLGLVWDIADILNGLMAIPNLVAILLLNAEIAKDTKYYLAHLDEKDTTEIPVVDK